MEKTTLYLPSELQLALRETARRQGRSQAEVVREAIARYVAAGDGPRPRSLGAFEQDRSAGEPVPARDAKRWVRQRWQERARAGDEDAPERGTR